MQFQIGDRVQYPDSVYPTLLHKGMVMADSQESPDGNMTYILKDNTFHPVFVPTNRLEKIDMSHFDEKDR